MRTIAKQILIAILLLAGLATSAQETYQEKVAKLEKQKEQITLQEKEALKEEVKTITTRLERGEITEEKARELKEEAARKRALNIEDRLAIIDNRIALLNRNKGEVLEARKEISIIEDGVGLTINVGDEELKLFQNNSKVPVYDRRTYSDFVLAVGFNNALIDGQSLSDSPYKVGGSRFLEFGWNWRTRVFRNSNFLRFNYGFSFQFNGLKPKDNQYFVENGNQTELQEFAFELNKSKLRVDNLVFPVHFEFGPSKVKRTDQKIRYSIDNQFRFGIGGYGGFNIGVRQKLKYRIDGSRVKDKLKRDYNVNNLVYGLSAYAGVGGTLLYIKYDLNPIFEDAVVEQRNISLGLRFDL
ncbi:hypothetical protein [Lentiprolixibacter aurantiacus]|uniref:Outer membrane protein beta-barrel domain-containing protein n=1 Tax=Lentiprolixibacter aurantiacus TaxID=2993939 RepID=A0AAE3MLI2_9FLAO|nr:hypothetical protein [Lentiprolixibacter aurantiacus]MCX2719152.1 hypothetical protein [Lentiprolixibacter aurantiacus]